MNQPKISFATIEQVIIRAKPEEQRRFLAHLPRLLKLSAFDAGWMKLSEQSFDFWQNPEDGVYDRL